MTNATRARTLGHLALYYVPGTETAARTLLEDIGCTLVDNGPSPGNDGFCTVLVDPDTGNNADNIFFLARMSPEQLGIEEAIRSAMGSGSDHEDPAHSAFREKRRDWPEAGSHVGVRFGSMEALEDALLALERDAAPGGPLVDHVEVTRFAARPGLDDEIDTRMKASPAFSGDERPAFADYWVQCFVKTDLFGMLSSAGTIELDYVFDGFFDRPPKFG
jgi:hypothetical protein